MFLQKRLQVADSKGLEAQEEGKERMESSQ
jgi:hypothetical protein